MPPPPGGQARPHKRKQPRAPRPPDADRTSAADPPGRWPAPSVRARSWPVRHALVAYAYTVVVGLAFSAVTRLVLGVRVPFGFGTLFIELTMLSALIPLHRSGRLSARDLGLRAAPGARAVGLCLLALVAYFAFAGVSLDVLAHPKTSSPFAGIAHRSTLVIIVTGFTAAVGAPVVEEIFFRGLLYRSLRNRLGTLSATSAAAVLFALVHGTQYPLAALPGIACFGVVACLLYQRTGSLVPGIAIHAFVDASAFEEALSGRITVTFDVFLILALGLLARAGIRGRRRRVAGRTLPVG